MKLILTAGTLLLFCAVPRFYPSVCRLMPTEKETLKECRTVFYGLTPDGAFKFEGLREGTYTIVMNEEEVGSDA